MIIQLLSSVYSLYSTNITLCFIVKTTNNQCNIELLKYIFYHSKQKPTNSKTQMTLPMKQIRYIISDAVTE